MLLIPNYSLGLQFLLSYIPISVYSSLAISLFNKVLKFVVNCRVRYPMMFQAKITRIIDRLQSLFGPFSLDLCQTYWTVRLCLFERSSGLVTSFWLMI